jgi:hypothetical protein
VSIFRTLAASCEPITVARRTRANVTRSQSFAQLFVRPPLPILKE